LTSTLLAAVAALNADASAAVGSGNGPVATSTWGGDDAFCTAITLGGGIMLGKETIRETGWITHLLPALVFDQHGLFDQRTFDQRAFDQRAFDQQAFDQPAALSTRRR
jgi:hypothetical protein